MRLSVHSGCKNYSRRYTDDDQVSFCHKGIADKLKCISVGLKLSDDLHFMPQIQKQEGTSWNVLNQRLPFSSGSAQIG